MLRIYEGLGPEAKAMIRSICVTLAKRRLVYNSGYFGRLETILVCDLGDCGTAWLQCYQLGARVTKTPCPQTSIAGKYSNLVRFDMKFDF